MYFLIVLDINEKVYSCKEHEFLNYSNLDYYIFLFL